MFDTLNNTDKLKDHVLVNADFAVIQFNERKTALDFTENSLKAVEEILDEASDFADEMPEKHIESIVELFGSYILAVASKEFEGRFYMDERIKQPVFETGCDFSIGITTFSKVEGRLRGDVADNIPFFYRGFKEKVKSAKSGDSALYV